MLGQWTYDAYGQCLSAQDFLGTPSMHLGHKGLFFDRLDEIAPEPGAADDPVRLIPYAHNLYHVRNRTYAPQLGRWMQRDPNATALTLADASSHHGRGMTALAVAGFAPDDLYGDGYNLYEYLGSNPWMRSDPSGLEWDPFDMVDDYIVEDMGAKGAFLDRIAGAAHSVAYIAAYIASYIPHPFPMIVGEVAMQMMGEPEALQNSELWQGFQSVMGYVDLIMVHKMLGRSAVSLAFNAANLAKRFGSLSRGIQSIGGLTQRAIAAARRIVRMKPDSYVYLLILDHEAFYVGVTNDLDRRKREHKYKGVVFDRMLPITPQLPRPLARAVETAIKISNPQFKNDANSSTAIAEGIRYVLEFGLRNIPADAEASNPLYLGGVRFP